MSLPYFNLYPTDFEADTSHLTLEEDGAYNRLLRLCWMSPGCSIPDDDAWIMRRMRVDKETFDRVVMVIIDEFFTRKSGRVSNARLAREFAESSAAHERRVSAGKKGGSAKTLKTNETKSSNAKAKPKQPEPEPEREKREPNGSPKKDVRGSRLPDDWRLPKAWGEWAVSEGLPPDVVRHEAECFRDYWIGKAGKDGVKLDWGATWRNWARRRLSKIQPQRSMPQGNFWTGKVLS